MNLEERFWSKVNIGSNDDCWEWNAGGRGGGYGCFKYNGKVIDSHRMVWFLIYGEFPELLVCHTCDNRLCCNPKHLFLGTHLDNNRDMKNKGRLSTKGIIDWLHSNPPIGDKNNNHKLKSEEVKQILKSYFQENISSKELANKYSVKQNTIQKILSRKRWKHITI